MIDQLNIDIIRELEKDVSVIITGTRLKLQNKTWDRP